MMRIENVKVGKTYRLNDSNESLYPNEALVEVLSIDRDDDDLIQVKHHGSNIANCQWVDAWELDEVDNTAKKQELKDILREAILNEEIQIESTPHGAIRISIDGKRLIES